MIALRERDLPLENRLFPKRHALDANDLPLMLEDDGTIACALHGLIAK
jgi:hypothetical protein